MAANDDVHYGYLSCEYADRQLGAFRLSKPPKFDRVQLSVDQGNHCFALIGKRAEILRWLDQGHPQMPVDVVQIYPWHKLASNSGIIKVSIRSVHIGYRFFYLMFGNTLTSKVMVEFSPWDGKAREGEPMPLDRTEIDAIPLTGESILIQSGSTMAQVAAKLRIKRRIMDEAGGIKVLGVRMERASTFSSVHNPDRTRGLGLSRHFSSMSTTSGIPNMNSTTPQEKKRFSAFSFPKSLSRGFGTKEE
ncbi:hypothetical protein BG004_000493 [Podila humilis]|nr:hypothetical protein BG004_000493 [Podila humilis]